MIAPSSRMQSQGGVLVTGPLSPCSFHCTPRPHTGLLEHIATNAAERDSVTDLEVGEADAGPGLKSGISKACSLGGPAPCLCSFPGVCLATACPSLPPLTWLSPLVCVCLISPVSFTRARGGIGAHLDNPGLSPHLKVLSLITSAKPLFPNKITLAGSRD